MSFDEPNADAYHLSHEEGSAGPLLGFMDSLDASWQAQTKVHSLLAVQQDMRAVEQEQIKKMREAGLRPHKSLDDSGDIPVDPFSGQEGPAGQAYNQQRYTTLARSLADNGSYSDPAVAERDKEIEAAKKERPDLGLMTYPEMFGKVREQAQAIEARNSLPKTVGGYVGSLIGGAAGGMNPATDPLSAVIGAATAPLGGATILGRVAAQGAAQGGTEALNLALGVDNENILLGHPKKTLGEQALQVAGAAVGGAAIQGVGEAAVIGGRRLFTGRWFNDVPAPKAEPFGPPNMYGPFLPQGEVPGRMKPGLPLTQYPDFESFAFAHGYDTSEYGRSREAALRTATDLDHTTSMLDQWAGPAPIDLAPPGTATTPFRSPEGVAYDTPYQNYIDRLETVDDVARRLDPDLFRQYDSLTQSRDRIKAIIDAAETRFKEFRGPDTFFERSLKEHENRQAMLRAELQAVDQQMRDLAPLVTRAYGQAEKTWRSTPLDTNTINFLKQLERRNEGFSFRGEGEPSLTEKPMVPRPSPASEALARITKLREAAAINRGPPTKAPRFQEWFAGSKVVDGNGVPLRVYHGTQENFDKFDRNRLGETTGAPSSKLAFFFAADGRLASEYAGGGGVYSQGAAGLLNKIPGYQKANEGLLKILGLGSVADKAGRVIPSYLDIKNPLIHDMKGDAFRETSYADLIRQAKAAGNDGVIIKNTYDPGFTPGEGGDIKTDIYAVFDPDQVTHAMATEPRFQERAVQPSDPAAAGVLSPDLEAKVKLDVNADLPTKVAANVAHNTELRTDLVDDFLKTTKELLSDGDKAIEAKQPVPNVLEMPDGSTLRLDDDRVPYVDSSGNASEMSVRDFLREMEKDQQALQSVMTCSRPSSNA